MTLLTTSDHRRRPTVPARSAGTVGHVLSWVVAIAATALVLLAVVVPRVSGATPYTVLTGSMAPTYPPGTLVVVKPSEDVAVGDAVTYQLRSGDATVVTHRVIGVGYNGDGEKRYTLQGDANEAPDSELVRPEQLRGEVWYSLPWVGHLGVLFTPGQHQLMVHLAAGALFLYAVGMLWQARRAKRGVVATPTTSPTPTPHPAEELSGV